MEEQNVNPESAISEDVQEATAEETTAENPAAPQAESEAAETNAHEEPNAPEPEAAEEEDEGGGITVNFDHKQITLTPGQTKDLAEKGMFFEKHGMKDVYNRLDYLASLSGKSIKEFVDGLITQSDDVYKASLVEKYGNDPDVLDALLDRFHAQNESKYKKILADRENAGIRERETTEARLANEFVELQKEFPELTEFSALPKEVKKAAAAGKDLLSAYLTHMHMTNKAKTAAKQDEEAAAQASTGSLGNNAEQEDSVISAFLSGLERA